MNFLFVLSKMAVLFAFVGLGLLCEKLNFLDDQTAQKLNKLIIYVCAPCLIVKSAFGSTLTYEMRDVLLLLLASTAYHVMMLLLSIPISNLFSPKKEDRKTCTFLMAYNNCVFMGFPVISAVFGDNALLLASVFTIPFNVFVYTIGPLFLSGENSLSKLLKATFLNPSFFATIFAMLIFFTDIRVPQPVQEFFNNIGGMVTPLALMMIGVSLSTVPMKDLFLDFRIYILALCRLVFLPLLFYFVIRLFIKDSLFLNLLTVLSVMPCAAVTPVFCREYGGNYLLASKGVFLSTVLALITVPVLLSLLLV